jgi:hypothetical protein
VNAIRRRARAAFYRACDRWTATRSWVAVRWNDFEGIVLVLVINAAVLLGMWMLSELYLN